MTKALQLVLPRGRAHAFPGDGLKLVEGLGVSLDRLHAAGRDIVAESNPGTATELLPEWHAALGIAYDSTRPVADQRAMLESVRCAIGGMTLNDLQLQIQREFPDVTVAEVSATSECGVAECGIAICNGREGDYSARYYDILGAVDNDSQLMRLGRICDHFAPAHLIANIAVEVRSLSETSSECGDCICGLGVAEGESGPLAPTFDEAAFISGSGMPGTLCIAYPGLVIGGPTPALSYQWKLNGSNISGATSRFLVIPLSPSVGDSYTCEVTATNASGSDSSLSDAVVCSGIAPAIISASMVLVNANTLGVNVSSTGYPSPTYAYQWRRNGSIIAGAIGPTYVFSLSGVYDCEVTATNFAGSDSRTTSTITLSAPSISGDSYTYLVGGTTLSVAISCTGSPAPAYTYQWRKDGSNIPGATSSTYMFTTPGTYDCVITATNAIGSDSAPSESLVIQAPHLSATPYIERGDPPNLYRYNVFLRNIDIYNPYGISYSVSYQYTRDGSAFGPPTTSTMSPSIDTTDHPHTWGCTITITYFGGQSVVSATPLYW